MWISLRELRRCDRLLRRGKGQDQALLLAEKDLSFSKQHQSLEIQFNKESTKLTFCASKKLSMLEPQTTKRLLSKLIELTSAETPQAVIKTSKQLMPSKT